VVQLCNGIEGDYFMLYLLLLQMIANFSFLLKDIMSSFLMNPLGLLGYHSARKSVYCTHIPENGSIVSCRGNFAFQDLHAYVMACRQ
jgi:hypothetical protein